MRLFIAGATRRALLILSSLAIAAAAAPAPAGAQQVQRIVAIVNDEIISAQDLEERLVMALASAQVPDTPDNRRRLRAQVLNGLVDEMLQVQEARRLNIRLTGAEIDRAIGAIAERNNVSEEELGAYLAVRNIRLGTLLMRLRAELVWSKLIGARFSPLVQVGDDEIEEAISRLNASRGKPEHLISEVFLVVTNPDLDEEIRHNATQLAEQARRGAPFDAIAEQFSQAATATSGGMVGWVQPGQIAPEIEGALLAMEVGDISEPIRAVGGYYVVKLHDRRRILVDEPHDTMVLLKQIMLPVSAAANPTEAERQLQRAAEIAGTVEGCEAFDAAIAELDTPGSGDLGRIRIGSLPPEIRDAVAELEIGRPSEPIKRATGVHVLMVCERIGSGTRIPDRVDIRQNLKRQRMALMARRYLRDLRLDAVIELR